MNRIWLDVQETGSLGFWSGFKELTLGLHTSRLHQRLPLAR